MVSSKAFRSVVLKFKKTLIFSEIGSLIFKRLWDRLVVMSYVKPVRTIDFTTLTYTFNTVKSMLAAVNGEIQKKASARMFWRFDSELAPRFQKFSTNLSRISAEPFVKIEKNYSNVVINNSYEKKPKSDQTLFYKKAFSVDSLLFAYNQIKLSPGNMIASQSKDVPQRINLI
jgi:hypothetical protein